MKKQLSTEVTLPEGVQVSYQNNTLTVQGSQGTTERKALLPGITIRSKENKVELEAIKGSNKEKNQLHTMRAHIKNMIKGVNEGHEYKLKICSGHFPMTVGMKGQTLEVKNFLGEKVPRTLQIPEQVKIKIEGDIITLNGIDKEQVGRTAGRIELVMKRPGFDKRVFQDGIYITEKDGKAL